MGHMIPQRCEAARRRANPGAGRDPALARVRFSRLVISGTGSFADEHGNVTRTGPGCHLKAPAGWLHRTLAGTHQRIVLGTSLPAEVWTSPINKDPAERQAALST